MDPNQCEKTLQCFSKEVRAVWIGHSVRECLRSWANKRLVHGSIKMHGWRWGSSYQRYGQLCNETSLGGNTSKKPCTLVFRSFNFEAVPLFSVEVGNSVTLATFHYRPEIYCSALTHPLTNEPGHPDRSRTWTLSFTVVRMRGPRRSVYLTYCWTGNLDGWIAFSRGRKRETLVWAEDGGRQGIEDVWIATGGQKKFDLSSARKSFRNYPCLPTLLRTHAREVKFVNRSFF